MLSSIKLSGSFVSPPLISLQRSRGLPTPADVINRDKDYAFIDPEGKMSLLDLSDGRRQLLVKARARPNLGDPSRHPLTFNPDHPTASGSARSIQQGS